MGKDKLQERAYEYLRTISPFKWHNLNKIPNDIFNEVWIIINRGNLDEIYNFGLSNQYSYLFMKTIKRNDT